MARDLIDLIEEKRVLGAEFLLWIWYEGERTDNLFSVEGEDIEVHFDDQIVLEAQLAEAEQSRLKGGAPSLSPEAKTALRAGKMVSKAKMRVAKGERMWSFMVDAATFAMSNIKTPAVLSEADDDKFYERMFLIEELETVWAGLYKGFLEARLDDGWKKDRVKIQKWIQTTDVL